MINAAELIFKKPMEMDDRIKKRIQPLELFGLLFGLGLAGIIYHYNSAGNTAIVDLSAYLRAGHGDYRYYYYAFWFLPIFHILDRLPFLLAYMIWTSVNLLGVWFAARVFGGRSVLALLSYQMFYLIFYGQISGLLIGALGLLAWAVTHKRWDLAGFAFLVSATKPQTGALIGIFILLCAPITWRERLRILPIPAAGMLISLIVYPNWIFQLVQTWQEQPANAFGSISLWQWFGPYCLVLWLPIFLMKMKPEVKFRMLVTASMLALPYFQQADLLALFVLPCGWLPLLGNLGYLMVFRGWDVLPWLVLIPLMDYGNCLIPDILSAGKSIAEFINDSLMERIKKTLPQGIARIFLDSFK
jgi:hypothetical protein